MNAQVVKYGGALSGAMLISLVLFLVMTRMISAGSQGAPQLEHYDVVDFVRLDRVQHPVEKEREKLPPQTKAPPPPPPVLAVQAADTAPPTAPMPLPDLSLDMRLAGGPVVGRLAPADVPLALDNEAIPLVRMPPVYPVRAERLHLGGVVVVEFTINEAGRVENPRVVTSKPPRIFDQAAKQAILRWRFKPKLEDGKAVSRIARQRFDFTPPEQ